MLDLGQFCFDLAERFGFGGGQWFPPVGDAEDILIFERGRVAVVFEVSGFGEAEVGDGEAGFFGGQDGLHFRFSPCVKFTLMSFALSVFSRVERTVWASHVTEHVGKDTTGDFFHAWAVFGWGGQTGVEVEGRELGVIVEHFLEMGHEPAVIDGVAGEATAELVMEATGGHGVESVDGGRQQ